MTVFTGEDRLEHCAALGRPTRMGTPAVLEVGDADVIAGMLTAGQFDAAAPRLGLFQALGVGLTETFLEWVIALPAVVEQRHPGSAAGIVPSARAAWRRRLTTGDDDALVQTTDAMLTALTPASISAFRTERAAGRMPGAAEAFMKGATDARAALDAALAARDGTTANRAFRDYAALLRERHDTAGELVAAFATAILERLSQETAIDVMQEGLESCALVAGMWDLIAKLDPPTLAAFLAEHLRGHFSGPGRSGSVRIVEDDEKIRLVFDPCGSGGALRRVAGRELAVFPDASPSTWGRSAEVPTYCAHCARNEITSISKLGYPAWVTEFDPDPAKPCGWTIYKRREAIPASYWTRVGATHRA